MSKTSDPSDFWFKSLIAPTLRVAESKYSTSSSFCKEALADAELGHYYEDWGNIGLYFLKNNEDGSVVFQNKKCLFNMWAYETKEGKNIVHIELVMRKKVYNKRYNYTHFVNEMSTLILVFFFFLNRIVY